ncbi:MAG: DJ-1/PfpI family protein [Alphaproteobacteria bacterium]
MAASVLSSSVQNVLILVASGVDEVQLTEMQRALIKVGAKFRVVAPEQGLVNGWHDNAWGHYFPVDQTVGEALGSDFDILVLPGGERSAHKLKQNLHTRRIINHFLDANKPISAIGEGVGLLALGTRCGGRTVSALPALAADLAAAQISVAADETIAIDGNLLTAQGPAAVAWIAMLIERMTAPEVRQAA